MSSLIACGSGTEEGIGYSSPSPKTQTFGPAETNVVDSIDSMSAGDLYYFDLSNGTASLDFGNDDVGANYKLIIQSTDSNSSSINLIGTSQSVPVTFDHMLRNSEKKFRPPDSELNLKAGANISKAVGDSADFKVLTSISNTSAYTTIEATLKCDEDDILLYIDNEVSSELLTDDDIEHLCQEFQYAAALEISILGEPSDINGDDHVVILVSNAVNALGESGGGIITGYFYSSDLSPLDPVDNPTSNEMEIIYILAPDPDAIYGVEITKEFAMENLMTAVVPHELQHAINYNQHKIINGTNEEEWLNEGLSHFSEDLVGFGQENPSRMETFFEYPQTVKLVTSAPDLSARGASYSFLRFLYEQTDDPDQFLYDLIHTNLNGTDNVANAFGGSDANFDEWNEFMRRWAIALVLTNSGISSNELFQYNDRTFNETTDHYEGVCTTCETEDGRGTILYGPSATEFSSGNISLNLSGTATVFYSISSPPDSLTIEGPSDSGLQGILIRMK